MLVVPVLVLSEVVNRWRELVQEQFEHLARAEKDLVALRALGWEDVTEQRDVYDLAIGVRKQLEAQLLAVGARLLETPDVPHDELVERALARRQPFDEKGKDGYRDALIWECVLSLVRDGHEVALISNDGRAFQDRKLKGTLSRDLLNEAVAETGRPEPVQLFLSVGSSLERLLEPDEEILASVDDALGREDVLEEFIDLMDDALRGISLSAGELDLNSMRFSAATIEDADTWTFHIGFARRAGSGEVLVEGTAHASVSILVRFDERFFAELAATESLFAPSTDADSGIVSAVMSQKVAADFDAVFGDGRFTTIHVSRVTSYDPD